MWPACTLPRQAHAAHACCTRPGDRYDGEEAVGVGAEAAAQPGDSMITSYRDHGLYVARGGSVLECIAELMGRDSGASKGLGGSMHM